MYFGFDTSELSVVHVKLGLSYVSEDNALENLDAESPAWDFDAVHQQAINAWNDRLGRVQVENGVGRRAPQLLHGALSRVPAAIAHQRRERRLHGPRTSPCFSS